jgi:hypothetical protein
MFKTYGLYLRKFDYRSVSTPTHSQRNRVRLHYSTVREPLTLVPNEVTNDEVRFSAVHFRAVTFDSNKYYCPEQSVIYLQDCNATDANLRLIVYEKSAATGVKLQYLPTIYLLPAPATMNVALVAATAGGL